MQKVTKKKKKKKRRLRKSIKYTGFVLLGLLAVGLVWLYLHPVVLKSSSIIAEYGESFDPLSAVRMTPFASEKDLVVEGEVDTSQKGNYTLTYTLKGKTETLQVEVKDTKAPVLEVQDVTTDMVAEITPEDFVASGSDAQEITYSFGEEQDLSSAGRHVVTIVATDPDGNETSKRAALKRQEDNKAPEMANVLDSYEIEQGDEVAISGIEVSDNLDPDPVFQMDTSGVDTTKPGNYVVKATVTDRSGNSAEQDLNVTVKENPLYGKKVVYLTFDDGPSYNTAGVLDVLKKNDVKATFFVTGNGGEEYDAAIKRAYDEGHTIGLHTWSHDYSYVYSSVENYWNDLNHISDYVENITGEKSYIIRFPGGSSNTISAEYTPGIMTELTEEVREKGYQYFDWNVSSGDANGNMIDKNILIANSEVDLGDSDLVILFHDGVNKDTTVEALQDIIDYYKQQGYVFAGLSLNSYPAHHGVAN